MAATSGWVGSRLLRRLRLARWRRRLVDIFPLTPLGLTVVGGSSAVLALYGLRRVDLILLVVSSVLLALSVLAILSVAIIAVIIRSRGRPKPNEHTLLAECGYPVATGFSLPSLWFVPFGEIRWEWLSPRASVTVRRKWGRLQEIATPLRRGKTESVRRRIEVTDPFGLTKIGLELEEPRTVRFLPASGALRQMTVVRSLSAGDDLPDPSGEAVGDRADLRRYAPGDPVRYILWKVFARSRQTFVRIPERAVSPGLQTWAYMVAGQGDEATAAAARVAVETGALGAHWTLGADGSLEDAEHRDKALDLVSASAQIPSQEGGQGLATFIDRVHRGGRGRLLVFAPAEPGPWVNRVLAAVRAKGALCSGVDVVIAIDGVKPKMRQSWLTRLVWGGDSRRETGADGTLHDDLRRVITELGSARLNVLLADRAQGRVYGAAHQRALVSG